jgi:hypothetical protein
MRFRLRNCRGTYKGALGSLLQQVMEFLAFINTMKATVQGVAWKIELLCGATNILTFACFIGEISTL